MWWCKVADIWWKYICTSGVYDFIPQKYIEYHLTLQLQHQVKPKDSYIPILARLNQRKLNKNNKYPYL
jgi:hypothetical protein